jgi:autonomous glycyl radical cofactor GrcA
MVAYICINEKTVTDIKIKDGIHLNLVLKNSICNQIIIRPIRIYPALTARISASIKN